MKYLLIALLLAVTLTSCFYESEVPLAGPHECLPPTMQGHWVGHNDDDGMMLLWIDPPKKGALQNQGHITVEDKNGKIKTNEKKPFLISLVYIGNKPLIQVAYYDKETDKDNYFFVKAEQKEKYLYLYLVQNNLFHSDGIVRQFSTSDSLQQEILRLMPQDGFYNENAIKFTKQ